MQSLRGISIEQKGVSKNIHPLKRIFRDHPCALPAPISFGRMPIFIYYRLLLDWKRQNGHAE